MEILEIIINIFLFAVATLFIILTEKIKANIKKGPIDNLFHLYIKKHVFAIEMGMFFFGTSFLFSVFFSLYESFYFKILQYLFLSVAAILFLVAGNIFLREIERVSKHKKTEEQRVKYL